jgi:hypothetical protein
LIRSACVARNAAGVGAGPLRGVDLMLFGGHLRVWRRSLRKGNLYAEAEEFKAETIAHVMVPLGTETELRFRARLGNGAPEVRFERVAVFRMS